MCEPCGVGSRGPLKGPGGVQGLWGFRERSPWKLLGISIQKQHCPRKLIYVRLLRHCCKLCFHASFLHTTCYAHNQSTCGTWYTNCQNLSWLPWFWRIFLGGVMMGPMLTDFLCNIHQFGWHIPVYLTIVWSPGPLGPNWRGIQIILISSIYGMHRYYRYENFATNKWKKIDGKGYLIQRIILAVEWRGILAFCVCVKSTNLDGTSPYILHNFYVKFLLLPSAISPSCRGTQIILTLSIYGLHLYEKIKLLRKKKKNCVGNNGKGMLKLPFQNGAPIQRAILGEALEWQGTIRVPPQPGCRRVCHPEPIGVTPLWLWLIRMKGIVNS